MVVLRNVAVACPADGSTVVRDVRLAAGTMDRRFEKSLQHHLVLQALVNAHDHLHQNCVPPLPQKGVFRNSYEWAGAFQSHFEDSGVKVALSTPLVRRLWQGGLKNALCGVTVVMHHDRTHEVLSALDFPVAVTHPSHWAHSLHLPYGPDVVTSFHATPTDMPWFIHLAEGVDPLAAGELRELRKLGCLASNTVLVHGVGLDDADVADVVRAGAAVVWCPSSNLKLLGQTITPPRLRLLFDAGRLVMGTDSRLTGVRDLLEELKVAAAHSDFSPRELMQLVTGHARSLLRVRTPDDCIIVRRGEGDAFAEVCGLERAALRAVIRDGAPLIADLDFEDWFTTLDVPCTEVLLDGVPKLCRLACLQYNNEEVHTLEPGLTLQ